MTAANWVIANGDGVSIGDRVALDLNPDAVGLIVAVAGDHTGRPLLVLVEGAGRGRELPVWPYQILLKLPAPTGANPRDPATW